MQEKILRLVGLTLLAASLAGAKPTPYKVSDKVKDLALKDTSGQTVKLSQFRGKVLVLAFSASF